MGNQPISPSSQNLAYSSQAHSCHDGNKLPSPSRKLQLRYTFTDSKYSIGSQNNNRKSSIKSRQSIELGGTGRSSSSSCRNSKRSSLGSDSKGQKREVLLEDGEEEEEEEEARSGSSIHCQQKTLRKNIHHAAQDDVSKLNKQKNRSHSFSINDKELRSQRKSQNYDYGINSLLKSTKQSQQRQKDSMPLKILQQQQKIKLLANQRARKSKNHQPRRLSGKKTQSSSLGKLEHSKGFVPKNQQERLIHSRMLKALSYFSGLKILAKYELTFNCKYPISILNTKNLKIKKLREEISKAKAKHAYFQNSQLDPKLNFKFYSLLQTVERLTLRLYETGKHHNILKRIHELDKELIMNLSDESLNKIQSFLKEIQSSNIEFLDMLHHKARKRDESVFQQLPFPGKQTVDVEQIIQNHNNKERQILSIKRINNKNQRQTAVNRSYYQSCKQIGLQKYKSGKVCFYILANKPDYEFNSPSLCCKQVCSMNLPSPNTGHSHILKILLQRYNAFAQLLGLQQLYIFILAHSTKIQAIDAFVQGNTSTFEYLKVTVIRNVEMCSTDQQGNLVLKQSIVQKRNAKRAGTKAASKNQPLSSSSSSLSQPANENYCQSLQQSQSQFPQVQNTKQLHSSALGSGDLWDFLKDSSNLEYGLEFLKKQGFQYLEIIGSDNCLEHCFDTFMLGATHQLGLKWSTKAVADENEEIINNRKVYKQNSLQQNQEQLRQAGCGPEYKRSNIERKKVSIGLSNCRNNSSGTAFNCFQNNGADCNQVILKNKRILNNTPIESLKDSSASSRPRQLAQKSFKQPSSPIQIQSDFQSESNFHKPLSTSCVKDGKYIKRNCNLKQQNQTQSSDPSLMQSNQTKIYFNPKEKQIEVIDFSEQRATPNSKITQKPLSTAALTFINHTLFRVDYVQAKLTSPSWNQTVQYRKKKYQINHTHQIIAFQKDFTDMFRMSEECHRSPSSSSSSLLANSNNNKVPISQRIKDDLVACQNSSQGSQKQRRVEAFNQMYGSSLNRDGIPDYDWYIFNQGLLAPENLPMSMVFKYRRETQYYPLKYHTNLVKKNVTVTNVNQQQTNNVSRAFHPQLKSLVLGAAKHRNVDQLKHEHDIQGCSQILSQRFYDGFLDLFLKESDEKRTQANSTFVRQQQKSRQSKFSQGQQQQLQSSGCWSLSQLSPNKNSFANQQQHSEKALGTTRKVQPRLQPQLSSESPFPFLPSNFKSIFSPSLKCYIDPHVSLDGEYLQEVKQEIKKKIAKRLSFQGQRAVQQLRHHGYSKEEKNHQGVKGGSLRAVVKTNSNKDGNSCDRNSIDGNRNGFHSLYHHVNQQELTNYYYHKHPYQQSQQQQQQSQQSNKNSLKNSYTRKKCNQKPKYNQIPFLHQPMTAQMQLSTVKGYNYDAAAFGTGNMSSATATAPGEAQKAKIKMIKSICVSRLTRKDLSLGSSQANCQNEQQQVMYVKIDID